MHSNGAHSRFLLMGETGLLLCSLTLALAGTLFVLLRNKPKVITVPNAIEISTHFQNDPAEQYTGHAYDQAGDPVCLTGTLKPIGKVKNVRLQRLQAGAKYWQLTLLIDGHYQAEIPRDSKVFHRWIGIGTNCEVNRDSRTDSRGRVLEIDPRAIWTPEAPAAPIVPIEEHAVLIGVVDGGCDPYANVVCDIMEFLPSPWWRTAIDRAQDFVVMDIGTIWIEAVGPPLVVVVAIAIFIRLSFRKRSASTFLRKFVKWFALPVMVLVWLPVAIDEMVWLIRMPEAVGDLGVFWLGWIAISATVLCMALLLLIFGARLIKRKLST